MAVGTAAAPITFTANAPVADLASTATTATDSATGTIVTHGKRGNWGGLIILGKAMVEGGASMPAVEGLAEPVAYGCDGGTTVACDNMDSSGTLQYVRV